MQTFLITLVVWIALIGLYVLGWIINNPWMVGFH